MALIAKQAQIPDYTRIARLSRELKPGYIWVTSGATEIGRLDYLRRHGRELEGKMEDVKADYSAEGQSILMSTYRQYVDPRYSIRQVLVEHQHFNDPLKREFLKSLLVIRPMKIVYISCEPETQARDLKALKKDYKVEAIQPVDMFPFTEKCETVVLLTRKE